MQEEGKLRNPHHNEHAAKGIAHSIITLLSLRNPLLSCKALTPLPLINATYLGVRGMLVCTTNRFPLTSHLAIPPKSDPEQCNLLSHEVQIY